MTRYKMDDDTIVDTDKATNCWKERSEWNGNNNISVNTGSQWHYQTLHLSKKGRYYLEHSSAIQGQSDSAEFIDDKEEAARWLLFNSHELPFDLVEYEEQIVE